MVIRALSPSTVIVFRDPKPKFRSFYLHHSDSTVVRWIPNQCRS